MLRDELTITQIALSAALLSFILLTITNVQLGRALLHSFLIFIFSYSGIYGYYILYHHAKHYVRKREYELRRHAIAEEKRRQENERPRSASERIGL